MALQPNYTQQVFIEIFDLECPGANGVSRREDVTELSDERRRAYAKHFADRIDREYYGVRIAKVTVETMETF